MRENTTRASDNALPGFFWNLSIAGFDKNCINRVRRSQVGPQSDRFNSQESLTMTYTTATEPLRIGSTAPDFEAETTQGKIRFHDWLGQSWGVFFSHPKDFTPVCTTELGYMAKIKPEFDKRNTKLIGLSVDKVTDHEKWAKDVKE